MDEDVGIGYVRVGIPTWRLPSRAAVGDSTRRARRAARRGIGGKREEEGVGYKG